MDVEGDELLFLFEALADQGGFEAELPNGEEDVIEKLEADAAAEAGLCGTADATGPVEERGVAVRARAGCCSQDVEEGTDGLFALAPKYLAGFLRPQEGGIFLYGDVLQATVLTGR